MTLIMAELDEANADRMILSFLKYQAHFFGPRNCVSSPVSIFWIGPCRVFVNPEPVSVLEERLLNRQSLSSETVVGVAWNIQIFVAKVSPDSSTDDIEPVVFSQF